MVDKKLLVIGGVVVGVVAIVAVIGVIAVLGVGCCAIGAMTVNEKNTAIDSWNTLADSQITFDSVASESLLEFGDHFDVYQSEITQTSPDYDTLKANFEADCANFEDWNLYMDDLNGEISDFSKATGGLTGDSKAYADEALDGMRTYHTEMVEAQMNYIGFCGDMVSYIESAEMGYPDDSMLKTANTRKDNANAAVQDAAAAVNRATDAIQRLQSA